MKKLLLSTLLLFIFSSSAFARDCLPEYEKVELADDGDVTGQYECIKLYPAKQNTVCPPMFLLKKTGDFSYKCNIVGIYKRYMCKDHAGNKVAGSNLIFKFSSLLGNDSLMNRFPAVTKTKYENESRRFGGNRNPYRIIAYQCN